MIGELIAERYELEERIGSGAMADVFRARDRRLGRTVALKILRESSSREPEHVERFRREALVGARLSHPNVVTVIERGESGGRQFIVFEHVEGETLKHLVERCGPLPVERALELAIEIGRGLAAAHARGIIHRDVKPQNVLLGDGGAKVADFGIARAAGAGELTLSGAVVGSGDYISPEQAGGGRVGERSDVYSLGVVLFELLAGDVPLAGETFGEPARLHTSEPAPRVSERRPDVPARVAATVARALEKEAGRRFPSMSTFVAELEACLAELVEPGEATAILAPSAPAAAAVRRRGGRRRRLALVFAALVACLAGAIAAVLFLASSRTVHLVGPASAAVIHLQAVATYDPPPGDGTENDRRLLLATDGDPRTSWSTEWYATPHFGGLKSGVGIVFDAGAPLKLSSVTVQTDTPSFRAIVEAGSSKAGPFQPVSSEQAITAATTITLHVQAPSQYYLVWITKLSPTPGPRDVAHVNEVTAT